MNIILKFSDQQSFDRWDHMNEHDLLIHTLDVYRSKQYFQFSIKEDDDEFPSPWDMKKVKC